MDKLRPASIGDADRGELGTQQSDGERREIGGNDDGGGDGDRSRSFEDDELQNPLIDDKTEEDIELYQEFMSLAIARAQRFGRKGSESDLDAVRTHDPLNLHRQELVMQRDWIEKRAVDYGNGKVAISCWDPLNKVLGWNRAMFELLGFSPPPRALSSRANSFENARMRTDEVEDEDEEEMPEIRGRPRETGAAADLEIIPGGDVESITNLLTASTRQHFLTMGERAVRKSVPFECLHEMYCKNERGGYTPMMMLSYAKNVGNGLWVSTIQIVSHAVVECLRNEHLLSMTVKTNNDRKNYEQLVIYKEEIAKVLELAMKNMTKKTRVLDEDDQDLLSGVDLMDEDSDVDCFEEEERIESVMVQRKADTIEAMYKSALSKSYKVHFPTAVSVVVEMVQERMKDLRIRVLIDETNKSFVVQMPVIAFQRCLVLLLEAIWFKKSLAGRDIALNIQVLDQGLEADSTQQSAPCRYVLRSSRAVVQVIQSQAVKLQPGGSIALRSRRIYQIFDNDRLYFERRWRKELSSSRPILHRSAHREREVGTMNQRSEATNWDTKSLAQEDHQSERIPPGCSLPDVIFRIS